MSEINVNHHTGDGDEEMERTLRAALQSQSDAGQPPSIVGQTSSAATKTPAAMPSKAHRTEQYMNAVTTRSS